MTDIDILLNHARVRTLACARVYELIKCMPLNKQFYKLIFLYYGSIINVSFYVFLYEVHV